MPGYRYTGGCTDQLVSALRRDGWTAFRVYGIPRTAGSKTAYPTKSGRVNVTHSGKYTRGWMQEVRSVLIKEVGVDFIMDGAVEVMVWFIMPRPKGHFRTGKNADQVKESAPKHPTGAPDTTKLWRAVEDAMKSVAWKDDSQVNPIAWAEKVYAGRGTPPGAVVAYRRRR